MTASDAFKREFQAGNLDEALRGALAEAIGLKISTWVASPDEGAAIKTSRPGHRLVTRINLVDGDVDNEVGDRFLTSGPYSEVRAFHHQQVQDGQTIIHQNVQGVQELFRMLASLTPESEEASRLVAESPGVAPWQRQPVSPRSGAQAPFGHGLGQGFPDPAFSNGWSANGSSHQWGSNPVSPGFGIHHPIQEDSAQHSTQQNGDGFSPPVQNGVRAKPQRSPEYPQPSQHEPFQNGMAQAGQTSSGNNGTSKIGQQPAQTDQNGQNGSSRSHPVAPKYRSGKPPANPSDRSQLNLGTAALGLAGAGLAGAALSQSSKNQNSSDQRSATNENGWIKNGSATNPNADQGQEVDSVNSQVPAQLDFSHSDLNMPQNEALDLNGAQWGDDQKLNAAADVSLDGIACPAPPDRGILADSAADFSQTSDWPEDLTLDLANVALEPEDRVDVDREFDSQQNGLGSGQLQRNSERNGDGKSEIDSRSEESPDFSLDLGFDFNPDALTDGEDVELDLTESDLTESDLTESDLPEVDDTSQDEPDIATWNRSGGVGGSAAATRGSQSRSMGVEAQLATAAIVVALGAIGVWGISRYMYSRQPTPLPPTAPSPQVVPPTGSMPNSSAPSPATVPAAPLTAPASPVSPANNAAGTTTTNFPDVPTNYWAYPWIAPLAARDIVSGMPDGTFRPNSPINRAEYASQLQRALTLQPQRQALAFGDVATDFWATPAIQSASSTLYLSGYPGNVFRPQQAITRLELLISLASGLELPPVAEADRVLATFQDQQQIPGWARQKVAAAVQSGLVVNYPDPNLLRPQQPATRAEATAMLYQTLVKLGKVQPVTSSYIVSPVK